MHFDDRVGTLSCDVGNVCLRHHLEAQVRELSDSLFTHALQHIRRQW